MSSSIHSSSPEKRSTRAPLVKGVDEGADANQSGDSLSDVILTPAAIAATDLRSSPNDCAPVFGFCSVLPSWSSRTDVHVGSVSISLALSLVSPLLSAVTAAPTPARSFL